MRYIFIVARKAKKTTSKKRTSKSTRRHWTKYTPERGRKVAKIVGESRHGLATLKRKNWWFPSTYVIAGWRQRYEDFEILWNKARISQARIFAEAQMIDEDKLKEEIHRVSPGHASALVNIAKLGAESNRWAASRLAPRDWGDKQEIDIKAKVEADGSIDDLATELLSVVKKQDRT